MGLVAVDVCITIILLSLRSTCGRQVSLTLVLSAAFHVLPIYFCRRKNLFSLSEEQMEKRGFTPDADLSNIQRLQGLFLSA